MNDCLDEALVKRGVPITIALSAATYYAIRKGFIRVSFISNFVVGVTVC